jgi:hypothetical protein
MCCLRWSKNMRVVRAVFNPGSMSTISAARDHLGDVLRSTVRPGPQDHCQAVDRRLALAGRHRNHTFGEAPLLGPPSVARHADEVPQAASRRC